MRGLLVLGVLLLAAAAAAGQAPDGSAGTEAAPGLTVLLYHPFPDAADPLGFPFPQNGSRDAFATRYSHFLESDAGFPYPYVVMDGLLPVAGLPDPQRPYASAYEAYEKAIRERAKAEAPATLEVASVLSDDALTVGIRVAPVAPLDRASLRLWAAVVEDHVFYKPPPALSNGVFGHRFTVRALADLGPVDVAEGAPSEWVRPFPLDAGWSQGSLFIAVWLQQEPVEGRFESHEVVQSALHPVGGPATVQSGRGVLLEMYTATWCDTCLYGDQAASDLADLYGVPNRAPAAASSGYWKAPVRPWLAASTSLASAGLAVLLVRRGGGP